MTFAAMTALPYPHLERATAGLRGELRQQLRAAGVTDALDWATLTVEGPTEFTDGRGLMSFGYWACLESGVRAK